MSTTLPASRQIDTAVSTTTDPALIPGLPHELSIDILKHLPVIEIHKFLEARGKTWWGNRVQIQTKILSLQKKLSISDLKTYQKIFSYRPGELTLKSWVQITVELSTHSYSAEVLDLSDDESLTDADLVQMIKLCPNLTHLNLRRSWNKPKRMLSDELFDALANCPKLAKLNLAGSEGLTVKQIKKLGQYCPKITAIDLSEARDITDPIIEEIAKQCPNLIGIDLRAINHIDWQRWGSISYNGLNAFAQCKNLEYISLIGRDNLSDKEVNALANSCPGLIYCDLDYCRGLITESSIDYIYACCPKLKLFKLSPYTPAWLSMCNNNRMGKFYQHLNYQSYDQARYSC